MGGDSLAVRVVVQQISQPFHRELHLSSVAFHSDEWLPLGKSEAGTALVLDGTDRGASRPEHHRPQSAQANIHLLPGLRGWPPGHVELNQLFRPVHLGLVASDDDDIVGLVHFEVSLALLRDPADVRTALAHDCRDLVSDLDRQDDTTCLDLLLGGEDLLDLFLRGLDLLVGAHEEAERAIVRHLQAAARGLLDALDHSSFLANHAAHVLAQVQRWNLFGGRFRSIHLITIRPRRHVYCRSGTRRGPRRSRGGRGRPRLGLAAVLLADSHPSIFVF
mmetsp:Transcript_5202/g.15267  ORF Transcript_5202/g.15267 Transcript_5202/m.15267 type:complete len:276 (-) Transcript_5202:523-1350(-)